MEKIRQCGSVIGCQRKKLILLQHATGATADQQNSAQAARQQTGINNLGAPPKSYIECMSNEARRLKRIDIVQMLQDISRILYDKHSK